jgi:putative membrane protein
MRFEQENPMQEQHRDRTKRAAIPALLMAAAFAAAPALADKGQAATPSTKQATTTTGATSNAAAGKLSSGDRKALEDLAESNLAEIAAARLALEKSQNAQVRAYAQRMIDEHTKAHAEVRALAQAKGVELPAEPNITHKAKSKMLEALSGDIFDRTYIKQSGRRDHRATHEKLKSRMNELKDPEVTALVTKMRPIVEQHLLMADEMIAKTARGAAGTAGTPGNDTSTATGKEPTPMKK